MLWQDPVRIKVSDGLLSKLFNMGVLPTKKSLNQCEKLSVSAFCRRRLPVVLVRLKFCETMREVRVYVTLLLLSCRHLKCVFFLQAVTFVEQGHIRVGKSLASGVYLFYVGQGRQLERKKIDDSFVLIDPTEPNTCFWSGLCTQSGH